MILGLLAAEITAKTGSDPGQRYGKLITQDLGEPLYARIDAPATREPEGGAEDPVAPRSWATDRSSPVEPITADAERGAQAMARRSAASRSSRRRRAGSAARPSGTEEVYKIYAESFRDEAHLAAIQEDARQIVGKAFAAAGAA